LELNAVSTQIGEGYGAADMPLKQNEVRFFTSQKEMRPNTPFKLYKISEEYHSLAEHMHDYFQIWYVKKGEFIHTVNNQQYQMVAGNLYVIPPYVVHRLKIFRDKETEILGCEFIHDFIKDQLNEALDYFLSDEGLSHSQIALSGDNSIQVNQLLEEMLDEYNRQPEHHELIIKGCLLKLLAHLIREWNRMPSESPGKPSKINTLMESVIKHIHDNYQHEIRLEDMYKRALVSRTYFCDMFKQYTGKTFSEYVIDLRLSKSMELLLTSDMTVTDVCFHVGFNHLTYFSRLFKKHTGVSPLYYKKHARK
jgi:AraC-like DNA-binding protein/mannose-6-phosphate isomerase-like protein (cupin superfamily)